MDLDDIKVLCIEADASKYGVAVETNDSVLLRSRIYPALKSLGIKLSCKIIGPNELWLLKK